MVRMKPFVVLFCGFLSAFIFFFQSCAPSKAIPPAPKRHARPVSKPPAFVFVHSFPGPLSISGLFPANTKLYILETQVCAAKTLSDTVYVDEAFHDFKYTPVRLLDACAIRDSGPLVALVSETKPAYADVPLRVVNTIQTILRLDSLARMSGVMDSLLQRNRGAAYTVDELIGDNIPTVQKLLVKSFEAYFLTYAAQQGLMGPRVAIIKDKAYALTGQCSSPALRAFSLNNTLYVQAHEGCCACGISCDVLFSLTTKGPVRIHDDYTLSN